MKTFLYLIVISFLFQTTVYSNTQWQKLNGPYGSAVSQMINHNGTVFITTNTGQSHTTIMNTVNNGVNWNNVSQQITGQYGRNFAAIGTHLFVAQDTTVFMTTNNGNTWVDVSGNLPDYQPITVIASHNSILFATTYDGSGFEELFYSVDTGATWTTTGFIMGINGSFNKFYSDGNNFWAATGTGVYLSTDNGLTWNSKSTNIPFSANIMSIAAHGDTLYCGASTGVYFSTDGANLWMPALGGITSQTHGTCYVISGNTVYMGTLNEGVYSTTLGTANWTPVGSLLNYTYVTCIAINNNELLIGLLDGFKALTLPNGSWTLRVDGLLNAAIRAVYADGNIVLASIGNTRGIYFSNDGGNTWQATTLGYGAFVFGIKKFGNTYFAFSSFYGLSTSTDGINWTNIPVGNGIHCIVSTGNKLVAGTGMGLYQSTDNGATWQTLGTGLPGNSTIYDLAVSGMNIYACNGSNKIYVSHNSGLTWQAGNGGVALNSICTNVEVVDGYVMAFAHSAVYRSSNNADTFSFASFSSVVSPYATYASGKNVFAATYGGVLISDDIGKTWHEWNDGFLPAAGLVYNFGVDDSILYCGTETNGVWKRNFFPELFTTTNTGSTYCGGTTLTVNFNTTSTFNAGNIFYVQLSDSAGHFANPVKIDSLVSTTPAPITASIPFNTNAGDKYRVRVVATDSYVVMQDNGFDFSVSGVPSIWLQPANQNTCDGSNTGFYVGARGTNISYQWQVNTGGSVYTNLVNNATYQGVNDSLLLILSATASMQGYKYRCIVSGTCAPQDTTSFGVLNVTSSSVTVNTQPVDVLVCDSTATSFTISASGFPSTYQWQVDNNGSGFFSNINNVLPYSGANSSTLNISLATASMNGYRYRCKIDDCVLSDEALLIVNGTPVAAISTTGLLVCDGDTARIKVTVPGAGITYQWQENNGSGFVNISNGGNYSGATTATLVVSNFTAVSNSYQYQCIINGLCNPFSSVSDTVIVNINSNVPNINQQPLSKSTCEKTNVYFSVNATGASLYYQWQMNNGSGWISLTNVSPFSGTNADTLKIDSVKFTMNNYQFRCMISGCTPSNGATLIVNPLPQVTLSQFPSVFCYNSPVIPLTGGLPSGGTYFGAAINNNLFDPSSAGVGSIPITYFYSNVAGCSASATQNLNVGFCIGQSVTEYATKNNQWIIYPNPASHFIMLTNHSSDNKKVMASIFNISGSLILKTIMEDAASHKIDIRHLTSGLYLMMIEDGDTRVTEKFVVIK